MVNVAIIKKQMECHGKQKLLTSEKKADKSD